MMDRYGVGVFFFYIAILLPISVLVSYNLYPNAITNIAEPAEPTFYPESLLLMINLVGFSFIILVFVIQNATQSFSSNLSEEVLNDNYLRFIVILFLVFTTFNITSIYFGLSGLATLISYSSAIASLMLLLSLTLIVAHYLDVSNILSKRKDRNIEKIDRERLFKPPEIEKEDEHQELINETSFYRNIGLEAVENNEYDVADTCIDCLEDYGTNYLDIVETPVEKEFVRHLNDQYYFFIHDLGDEYSHQKNLETLVDSLGHLSRETYKNTKDSRQTLLWLNSLKEVFEITEDGLDRTDAYGTSIREINRTILLYLNDDDPHGFGTYGALTTPLEEIVSTSVEKSGNSAAIQISLAQFEWQLITIINNISTENRLYSDQVIENVLNAMVNIHSLSKDSDVVANDLVLASYFRLNSLMANIRYYGIYGLDPNHAALISSITSEPPAEAKIAQKDKPEFSNPRTERELLTIMMVLGSLVREVTNQFSDTNYYDFYSGYPELLFICSYDLDGMVNDDVGIINVEKQLTEYFCDSLREEIGINNGSRPRATIIDQLSNYLVILYYTHLEDDDRLFYNLIYFAKLYSEIREEYSQEEAKWLYRHLKLFGALIHNRPQLNKSRTLLNQLLAHDFYEPNHTHSQIMTSALSNKGYPDLDGMTGYPLSANQVWSQEQQMINQKFKMYLQNRCDRYHKYLKREQKWI
ncbi:uncharacterized protein Nmag_0050 [Natrialba magadii ATCC 43099]|uniref:DUF2254 domain-containing protein n=3 Tax=Natrialba magadii TaxID=13769 RepID=D3SVT0_NATMM|nr:uncharacterized protein Nmag_0050 [Natrialba magadii ATCC 43099]